MRLKEYTGTKRDHSIPKTISMVMMVLLDSIPIVSQSALIIVVRGSDFIKDDDKQECN
jgi:hypothetical protein